MLAQDAARLIRVHYEPLLHVIEVDDAIKPDAPAYPGGLCRPHPSQMGYRRVAQGWRAAGEGRHDPIGSLACHRADST
ncbi:hypothetical protein Q1M64_06835 (plasmid) [Sinorhizobium meliloti]|nr:hypothetical protein Q1M63_08260 [Sinorhizobium meliloti]WKL39197.1 hypothetical protein Q1M64_06835 [Sinorhizobium meliloti]